MRRIYNLTHLLIFIRIVVGLRPLVITSDSFLLHRTKGFHPECPDRLQNSIEEIKSLPSCEIKAPSAETNDSCFNFAAQLVQRAHSKKYVDFVKSMCEKNAPYLSPYDSDTYLSPYTFNQCIEAQSAWINGLNAVINDNRFAFAVTRPPGHHASTNKAMGFCIFNFAVGTALYALDHLLLERVAILDFDVHYGNGIAEMISPRHNIR